ncbi:hypothetical protein ACFYN3_01710 [Streptomyces lavendulae]|uniref:hypothetical protein n=1 Tax=Streptomyces lavendulae TaxID=1914 RepID=UPI00340B1D0D
MLIYFINRCPLRLRHSIRPAGRSKLHRLFAKLGTQHSAANLQAVIDAYFDLLQFRRLEYSLADDFMYRLDGLLDGVELESAGPDSASQSGHHHF